MTPILLFKYIVAGCAGMLAATGMVILFCLILNTFFTFGEKRKAKAVSKVIDQSGNGRHLVQPVAGLRPVVVVRRTRPEIKVDDDDESDPPPRAS